MKDRKMLWKWGWRVLPIGVVVAMSMGRQLVGGGAKTVGQLVRLFATYGILVAGWVLGWMLPDLLLRPEVTKRLPTEIAKGMKQAIYNLLTVGAFVVVGIWVVSSSGSPFAGGLVFGICVRLFTEALVDPDYKRWYWVFARNFLPVEHKIILILWGTLLLIQLSMMTRG